MPFSTSPLRNPAVIAGVEGITLSICAGISGLTNCGSFFSMFSRFKSPGRLMLTVCPLRSTLTSWADAMSR